MKENFSNNNFKVGRDRSGKLNSASTAHGARGKKNYLNKFGFLSNPNLNDGQIMV